MRYLKYVALLAVLMVPFAYSQAQVRVGIGIGVGPVYVAGPPVCPYGYYGYYPYACAPYGYYGPRYFVNGIFIGAGPWYHWGHPAWFWNRAVRGTPYVRVYERSYRPGFRGSPFRRGGEFRGHGEFHGGGFHGRGYAGRR